MDHDYLQSLPAIDSANDELDILSRIEPNGYDPMKDNVYITERGIKFMIQKVSPYLMMEAKGKIKFPEVPVVHIEEDDRDEENPNDPVYIAAWQEAKRLEADTHTNLFLGLGTYTKREWLPSDVDYYMDDDAEAFWIQALDFAGIKPPPITNRLARYVAWMKYYAVSIDDMTAMVRRVAVYSGFAQEAEVQEAIESFPDNEERDTDNGTYDSGED